MKSMLELLSELERKLNSKHSIDSSSCLSTIETGLENNLTEEIKMNLDEAFPSKFLKSADLGEAGTEVLVTIKDIKGITEFKDGGKSLDVEFVEFDKILGMNKTNRESTAIYLRSRNTDEWIGKKVVLYVDLVRNQQGNMVDAIRVKPAPKPRIMQAATQQQRRPIVLDEPRYESENPAEDMDDSVLDDDLIPF